MDSGHQKQNLYICVLDIENVNNGSSAELEEDEEQSEPSINEDESSEEETSQINSMLLN